MGQTRQLIIILSLCIGFGSAFAGTLKFIVLEILILVLYNQVLYLILDDILPVHNYVRPDINCDLDLYIELCLKQSAYIIGGNYSVRTDKNLKKYDTKHNDNVNCHFDKLSVVRTIDSITNDVLNLATFEDNTDKIQDKLETIRNNLLLLNNLITQMHTPSSLKYFTKEYISIATSKVRSRDLILENDKRSNHRRA